MTITAHAPATSRSAPDSMRRTSLAAGILYLISFVSIPSLLLYNPVRDNADFVLGAGRRRCHTTRTVAPDIGTSRLSWGDKS